MPYKASWWPPAFQRRGSGRVFEISTRRRRSLPRNLKSRRVWKSRRSAQDQLLHPPIRSLADVQLTLGGARERVCAGELSEVASRATDHPQHGAVERNLEDSSRVCRFPNEEHLSGPGRHAERIGCSDRLLETLARGRRAVDGARRGIRWHIDREHPLE